MLQGLRKVNAIFGRNFSGRELKEIYSPTSDDIKLAANYPRCRHTLSDAMVGATSLYGVDELRFGQVTESVGLSGGEANRLVNLTLPKEMIERCKVK